MLFFLFANAAARLAAGTALAGRNPLVYLFAIGWVVPDTVLAITAQFGIWDLMMFALLLELHSLFFPLRG